MSGGYSHPSPGGFLKSPGVSWPLLAPDGAVGAPSYSFLSDPDTGFYWGSANQIRVAVGGAFALAFSSVNLIGAAIPSVTGGAAGDIQIAAGATSSQVFIVGRRAAGDATADVVISPGVTRTAGHIVGVCATASTSAHVFTVTFEGCMRSANTTGALATAPGADFGLLRWEDGTNAGTLKLVAYSGTSTTGVTVVDNVGAGN
jgi:hypothetical protein